MRLQVRDPKCQDRDVEQHRQLDPGAAIKAVFSHSARVVLRDSLADVAAGVPAQDFQWPVGDWGLRALVVPTTTISWGNPFPD
jgi:hypothetical protein